MTNYEAYSILRDVEKYDCDKCQHKSCDDCKLPEALNMAMEALLKIDQNVEKSSGKWINDKDDIPRCSCCSYIPEYSSYLNDYYYSDFCPNCGAKMEQQGEKP